ncbi:hypothetical protein DUNSADRAFT_8256 [Dunaliella salina]|uniref:UDP-glucose:glycoprotein glucosyltransferase n=1 Tax=Dunaliella salina TaxID=3046 RepID=A0ABQ7HA61_DUNSA|nr:hypothetical protein DUNSADRAFT_8256 [Dunaliella salina]|eukprot:KAF5843740.1 hypothetical protein DUNSADRAFT_8256 [Dunaliella salina]
MRSRSLLLALFFWSISLHLSAAVEKGASVTLAARWPGTSFLLEAAEMLAAEDPAHFWEFLRIASETKEPRDTEQCWSHIMAMAGGLLPPSIAQLSPLVLSSRQYSAKVEMNRQLVSQLYPDEACCFADVGGHIARSPSELSSALDAARRDAVHSTHQQPQLFDVDHIFGGHSSQGEGQIVVVLYGPLGAQCTWDMHVVLAGIVQQQQQQQQQQQPLRGQEGSSASVVYALRPVLTPNCQVGSCAALGTAERVLLPGYGVEAVLKNTEYSAMDEKDRDAERRSKSGAGGEDVGASEEEHGATLGQVGGFDFDVLVARKPELREELLTLRDHLLSADEEEEAVKVWELKDIGLQATQRITQAADPLRLLADISQNFPSLVSSLSRQKVNSTLRSAVAKTQQFIPSGTNFMLVNGLAVDIDDFDLYGFLDRLRAEVRLQGSLHSLGLATNETVELLQLRSQDSTDTLKNVRLDLGLSGPKGASASPVVFINNLEKDKMYTRRLSSSVMDVLNTFPGRLRPMAINAYVFVLVIDPISPEGMAFVDLILQMWQEMYPLRMGVTFSVPSVHDRLSLPKRLPFMQHDMAPKWASQSTSERLARAFLTIESVFGGPAAFGFWSLASRSAQAEGGWDSADADEVLRTSFTAAWSSAAQQPLSGVRARTAAKKLPSNMWGDLVQGSGYAAEAGMRIVEMCQWQQAKGIARGRDATGWLNGQQMVFKDGVDESVQQELLYMMVQEQQRLQEMVFYGSISEDDDVQDMLVSEAGAVGRWSPDIMSGKVSKVLHLGAFLQDPEYSRGPISFFLPRPAEDSSAKVNKKKSALVLASKLHPVTHIVVANLNRREGREQLAEGLRFLVEKGRGADKARVVLVLNPSTDRPDLTLLEVFLHLAVSQQLRKSTASSDGGVGTDMMPVATFMLSLLQDYALSAALSGPIDESSQHQAYVAAAYADKAGLSGEQLTDALVGMFLKGASRNDEVFNTPEPLVRLRGIHSRLARDTLGMAPGASAVITNGHVYPTPDADDAPVPEMQAIVAEDLALLTLLGTRYQPGPAMAAVVAGAYDGGKLEGVVPARGGAAAQSKLDDLLTGVSAAVASTAAKSASGAEELGSGGSKGPQVSKQVLQVLSSLKAGFVEAGPKPGTSPSGLHIVCVFDPLTRAAQRMSQVLGVLRDTALAPSISLLLNPQRDMSDMPLKSYYRFALPDLSPGEQASAVAPGPPIAYFQRLPTKKVLTMNMDVPEAWLVEATQAAHDVDNIRLADIEGSIAYTEYELDALMLTGSCVDVTQGSSRMTPPRGLQLHLGTFAEPHIRDTLVMSNLAYFQLKAAPGMWQLSLAPGRTQEIYVMQPSASDATAAPSAAAQEEGDGVSQGGTCSNRGSNRQACADSELSTGVVVSSLAGKHMILRVHKRPGKEREDVLKAAGEVASDKEEEEEEDLDMADYEELLLGLSGQAKKKPPPKPAPPPTITDGQSGPLLGGEVINVFTVASGHMYERLQKIMVLSVIKNTKSRVKFWFIKNYMSPQHKQVIPAMAKHYGFDYEFVTYKWPNWLHKQTDKQRIIWAYKILFLDVLFPLGVERIIFVDSDQVVRTDLADLYHMDIRGKPYAYTPFCNNNKEMDEFRFWKGGFWSQHLRGKPYHISALYLVDLKRFRAMAAGDQLRVVYDQLSKDPHSLANLDQDLPNYVQHSIPIFSLPKEWLWCESWCGDSTKSKAKTIDLCNNPKTKEPKLTAARRIIAEWPALDAEQADFTRHAEAEVYHLGEGDQVLQSPGQLQNIVGASTGETKHGGREGGSQIGGKDEL